MEYHKTIQSIANDRGIDFLLHFTQIKNLPGIVKYGLLPRRDLENPIYSAFASAAHRLDENSDAISVSISQINEHMFASKRRKSGHDDWVVLVISAEILWTHSCRFCWCNAARKEIKNHRGWRGGPWAFAKMFSERDGTANGLPRSHPNDPEAEVQVLEPIDSKSILGAVVNRSALVVPVQEILRGLFEGHPVVSVEKF